MHAYKYPMAKGKLPAKDMHGNKFMVAKDDPRLMSGELVSIFKNTVVVKDPVTGKNFRISKDDPRYLNNEFPNALANKVNAVDAKGDRYKVDKDDARLASGELKHLWSGKKHKPETKQKIGQTNQVKQKGALNSQYEMRWISNGIYSKKVSAYELEEWLSQGWVLGSKSANLTQNMFQRKQKTVQQLADLLSTLNTEVSNMVEVYYEKYLQTVDKAKFPKLVYYLEHVLLKNETVKANEIVFKKINFTEFILSIEYSSKFSKRSSHLILNVRQIMDDSLIIQEILHEQRMKLLKG